MARKLSPLAFVLALVAAACAEPPSAEIEFGSGVRFVSLVADPLNDAGRNAAVAVTEEGLPLVAYVAYEEETEEDELPQTRPVGAPSIPGIMLATVSPEGIWSRGAIVLQAQIPNVQIPFNPAFDGSIADLVAGDVTGLDLVVDGATFHATWGTPAGLFHATGSTDPATTEQVEVSQVTDTITGGPSIAVVGGTPRIAYHTTSVVEIASRAGGAWTTETVSPAGGCATCSTAIVAAGGGPAVAWSEAGDGVRIATPGGDGWAVEAVAQTGGEGLDATVAGGEVVLSYYDGGEVVVATGTAGGPFADEPAGTAGDGVADAEGSETSIAADESGATWLAFVGADGIVFVERAGEGFEPLETGGDTAGGAMPSVAVTPDGSTAYLAWYDTEQQDALVGEYGEIEGLAIAAPSPDPGVGAPIQPPSEGCAEAIDGVVEIVALGIAFDVRCVEVPAGEPFSIAFANQDEGVQHNVAIFPSADELQDPLFRGEIFPGVDTVEYQVGALEAGEYYFHCDVHPNMNGTWNVVDGGGGGGPTGATGGDGGGGGGGDGGALAVVAEGLAFDTSSIELPAGEESTITFENRDAGVQHNIAIFTDDSLGEVLFRGELFAGVDTVDYTIPPLDAGEYYFHCDVHPDMNGAVVVA